RSCACWAAAADGVIVAGSGRGRLSHRPGPARRRGGWPHPRSALVGGPGRLGPVSLRDFEFPQATEFRSRIVKRARKVHMSELVLRVRPGRECSKCGESSRALMSADRRAPDGHSAICRQCKRVQARVRMAAWRSRSPEQVEQVRLAKYPDGLKWCG